MLNADYIWLHDLHPEYGTSVIYNYTSTLGLQVNTDHTWLHPEYGTWFHLNNVYISTLWLHNEY